MVKAIAAIYENGVLKPEKKLSIPEHSRLKLKIEWQPPVLSDTEKLAGCFKKYALKKAMSLNKSIDTAVKIVAHEIAQKNN
ncbi:MAG: antitoxin family protein [Nitrospirae bacterium]|nr:antitoxin family protein [Nitrospirota bacterium]